jgi:tRNA(fMet)-specific endonuclease VapC
VSWLLDTNTCSYVLKRRFGLAERLRGHSPADLYVCAITLAEARAGARKSVDPERLIAAWEYFLQPFADRILPFDKAAAHAYGDIRAHLEKQGIMIGDRDCMIAAIAQCHGLTVVTGNIDEFQRVPGLTVEDWRVEPATGC